MTIHDLIEKLGQENKKRMNQGEKPNGAYGVLETLYNDLFKMDPENIKEFNNNLNTIQGIIWGLKAAFFITDEEKKQLLDELMQIANKFYNIEED